MYDATKGKSDGAVRDLPSREERVQLDHAVEMGAVTAAKIISTVKSKALEDKFKPASAIVNEECVVLNIILFL